MERERVHEASGGVRRMCAVCPPAASAGKDKFDARWKEGVWLGVRMESGESLIGTDGGVVKARDFSRKAENGGRWSVTEFDKFVGVPWEPYPGAKGGFELRSKVRLPTEHAEFTETVTGKNEFVRRRFRIKRDNLEKFGYTTGCPGCRAEGRRQQTIRRSVGAGSQKNWRRSEM